MVSAANAQTTNNTYQNISGFSLPGVTLPQGHDEVRAADGTTCRSAVAGNGAYIDAGVIGNPEQSSNNGSVAAYTRVVIPLGQKTGRIDCRRLYDLEVRRLEIELKLMELGLNRGIAPVSETAERPIDSSTTTATTSGSTDADNNASPSGAVEVAQADTSQSTGDSWDDDGWGYEGINEKNN